MPSGGLWEHDLWEEIYAIEEPGAKRAIAQLYRLILDMRNNDLLATKIAAALASQSSRRWKFWHKALAVCGGILLVVGQVISISHGI